MSTPGPAPPCGRLGVDPEPANGMTDGDSRRRWAVTAICGDCLQSDTGRAILSGAVGVGRIGAGPVERCILCGYPFADVQEESEMQEAQPTDG